MITHAACGITHLQHIHTSSCNYLKPFKCVYECVPVCLLRIRTTWLEPSLVPYPKQPEIVVHCESQFPCRVPAVPVPARRIWLWQSSPHTNPEPLSPYPLACIVVHFPTFVAGVPYCQDILARKVAGCADDDQLLHRHPAHSRCNPSTTVLVTLSR